MYILKNILYVAAKMGLFEELTQDGENAAVLHVETLWW